MSWLNRLFANGIGNVFNQVGNVIDKFHLSKEEKQQFKLELQRALMQRESEIEQSIRKNLEAKERILTAELQQDDSYTKRARPTVVYFGLIMIALNYFLMPAILLLSGKEDKLQHCSAGVQDGVKVEKICTRTTLFPLPDQFWVAWGGIVATWAVGRSFEKAGASNRMSRMVTGNSNRPSLLAGDEVVG